MKRLTMKQINLAVRKSNIRGKQDLDKYNEELDKPTLTDKEKEAIERSRMSEDQYLAMLEFAKEGARLSGKRQLKLNFPALRDMLVSDNLERGVNSLTDRSGLSRGGKVGEGKPLELLDQRQHLFNLINNNKLRENPNPTSFKINFLNK